MIRARRCAPHNYDIVSPLAELSHPRELLTLAMQRWAYPAKLLSARGVCGFRCRKYTTPARPPPDPAAFEKHSRSLPLATESESRVFVCTHLTLVPPSTCVRRDLAVGTVPKKSRACTGWLRVSNAGKKIMVHVCKWAFVVAEWIQNRRFSFSNQKGFMCTCLTF